MTNEQRGRLAAITQDSLMIPVQDRLAIRVLLDEHALLVQENGRLRSQVEGQSAVLDMRASRAPDGPYEHCIDLIATDSGFGDVCAELDRAKNEDGWDLLTAHPGTAGSRIVGGQQRPVLVCVMRRLARQAAHQRDQADAKAGPARRRECGK